MEYANTMAALYQIALNPPPTLREANWTSDLYEFVEYVLKKDVSYLLIYIRLIWYHEISASFSMSYCAQTPHTHALFCLSTLVQYAYQRCLHDLCVNVCVCVCLCALVHLSCVPF